MNSDDVANSLRNGQILEPIGKQNKARVLNCAVTSLVNLGAGIGNLERADELVRLEGLVRELGIDDNSIKVNLFVSSLETVELFVLVMVLLFSRHFID